MTTLISEECEWEAREFGSTVDAYEIRSDKWSRRIPSHEEQWADVEAQLRSQDVEDVDDCPPVAMLIVILAGVAITSAIIATFPGG